MPNAWYFHRVKAQLRAGVTSPIPARPNFNIKLTMGARFYLVFRYKTVFFGSGALAYVALKLLATASAVATGGEAATFIIEKSFLAIRPSARTRTARRSVDAIRSPWRCATKRKKLSACIPPIARQASANRRMRVA